jgi:hypothetical protein
MVEHVCFEAALIVGQALGLVEKLLVTEPAEWLSSSPADHSVTITWVSK